MGAQNEWPYIKSDCIQECNPCQLAIPQSRLLLVPRRRRELLRYIVVAAIAQRVAAAASIDSSSANWRDPATLTPLKQACHPLAGVTMPRDQKEIDRISKRDLIVWPRLGHLGP
jgi:hypothetical protein